MKRMKLPRLRDLPWGLRKWFHQHSWDVSCIEQIRTRKHPNSKWVYGCVKIERCSNPECFKERGTVDLGFTRFEVSPEYIRHGIKKADFEKVDEDND